MAVVRITPAYAGKSSLFPRSSVILEDHPRLCGEKPPSACTGGRCGGSPPPMRGKDLSAGQLRRNHRITPAYAGKSSCHKKEARGNRDHPRLCGEKPASSSLVMFQPGSPPPMRGKDAAGAFRAAAPGITPAYAGKRHTQRKILPDTWDHPRLCGEKKDTRRRKWRQSGSPPPMRGKVQSRQV